MTDQPAKREKSRDFDLIGKTIADKYRVLRVLGQGGFGAVYLVEIVAGMLGEKLALKVLPAELSQDEVIRERFLNEIRVAMRLVNKYIVQIRDVGVTDTGQLYYTMDYSPGVTLTEVITANRQLPVMKTLALVRRVLRGLVTAHKEGVIHRDLKPGNLMVEDRPEGETVRILDFGIATALQSPGQKGRIVGSPLYMPPEQYVGQEVGFYTDLYSIGVILYECLSGQRPYTGKTPKEVFNKMKSGPPRAIQDLCPDVVRYPGLADVVMKALERDPARRYQSAQELFNDLTAIGKAAAARKAEAPRVTPKVSTGPSWGAPSGRPRLSYDVSQLIKIAVLLAVIGGAFYFLRPYFSDVAQVVEDTKDRLGANREPEPSRKSPRGERTPKPPRERTVDPSKELAGKEEENVAPVEPAGKETPAEPTPEETAIALLDTARDHGDERRWEEAVEVTVQVLALPDVPSAVRREALEVRAQAQFSQGRYSSAADSIDRVVEEYGEEQVDDELLLQRFKARARGGPLALALDLGDALRGRGYDTNEVILLLLETAEKLENVEKIKLYLDVAKQRGIDAPSVKRLHAKYSKPEYTPAVIAQHGQGAEQAYLDGDYVDAIARSAGVFKDTRDPNVGYTLARAYLANRDYQGTLDTIEVLLQQPEIAPEQRLRLQILAGRASIPFVAPTKDHGVANHVHDTAAAQERLRQALESLRALGDLDKRDHRKFEAQIQTHLGLCFALEGNLSRTDGAVLRNKAAAQINDPELVLEQGLSYVILGRLAPTSKNRQTARERTVARMKRFNEISRDADPRGYEVMGIGYFEQGKSDYGKAVKAFKAAIRDNEKCAKRVRVDAADLQLRLARAYEKRGESGNRQSDFRHAGTHFKNAYDLRTDSDLCFSAARNFIRGDRARRGCEILTDGLKNSDSGRLRQLYRQHCNK